MERYLIVSKNMPFAPITFMNQHGTYTIEFSKEEAMRYVAFKNSKYEEPLFECVTVEEWEKRLVSPEFQAYCEAKEKIVGEITGSQLYKAITDDIYRDIAQNTDKNINGFSMPFEAESNEDYEVKLKKTLDDFLKEIDRPAFRNEGTLVDDVKEICQKVIVAYEAAKDNDRERAGSIICSILKEYEKNPFAITELDKSYAFRGVAPFGNLRQEGKEALYKRMMAGELSFFRARVVDNEVKLSEISEINYLSYSNRNLAKDLRFSSKNEVCLYLGTTSYVCAREMRWKKEGNLYLASYRFNEKGKKLKILNLVVLQSLLNGLSSDVSCKELHNDMIRVFPLVIATMFTVKTNDKVRRDEYGETIKSEYLLSQIIIEELKKAGIDGVAYLSRQGTSDFQYPHMVCVAIPITDADESKEYGSLSDCYEMTSPILFHGLEPDNMVKKKSYINEKYPKYMDSPLDKIENCLSKIEYGGKDIFYGDTIYSKVDDYLVNSEHIQVN